MAAAAWVEARRAAVVAGPGAAGVAPVAAPVAPPVVESGSVAPVSEATPAAAPAAGKYILLRKRLDRYRDWVDAAKQSGKDKIAADALEFINPNSRKRSLRDMAEELATALEKARKQRQEKIKLITGSIVAYWLDIACLWEGTQATLGELKEVLDTMGLTPDDPEAFYREWRGTDEEVAALQPDQHMQAIREVLTGQR